MIGRACFQPDGFFRHRFCRRDRMLNQRVAQALPLKRLGHAEIVDFNALVLLPSKLEEAIRLASPVHDPPLNVRLAQVLGPLHGLPVALAAPTPFAANFPVKPLVAVGVLQAIDQVQRART